MPNKNKSIKNLLNPLKLSLYKTYFIVIHKFTLSGAQLSDIFMTNKLERPVHQQQHLGVFFRSPDTPVSFFTQDIDILTLDLTF